VSLGIAFPVLGQSPDADSSVIYVARRGWHIDIGFATADLQAPLNSTESDFPGATHIFFGFGDKRYLLATHRNAPVLLAALWPGSAMILATGLAAPPAQAFGAPFVVAVRVSPAQAIAAQQYVWETLDKAAPVAGPASSATASVAPIPRLSAGPYRGSLFYAARSRYSALHTCNTWAAEVLKAAGLPVHSTAVLFSGQLWSQVKRLKSIPLAEQDAPATHSSGR
jgi:Protein of unknown function (DUF2459)